MTCSTGLVLFSPCMSSTSLSKADEGLKQLSAWSTGLVGRDGTGEATRLGGIERGEMRGDVGVEAEADGEREKTRVIGGRAGVRLGRMMVRVMMRSSRSSCRS